jgi:hypothetical protein
MAEAEPRRLKLPSELSAKERAEAKSFGGSGRVERDEYRQWRRRTLKHERDDLDLRARLLREESEDRQRRAAAVRTAALEAMSAEDWHARMQAKRDGAEVEALDDGGAAGFEAEADEYNREADEIEQFLAETKETA